MRRTVVFSSAVGLLLIGSGAFAQAKPNYTGKWTILPDSSPSAMQQGMPRGGADMGGLGEEGTITVDDKTLTIGRSSTVVPQSVFNLDGTETRQTVDIGNGNLVDLTLKAKWDGNKILTSTWATVQGQSFEIVLNLSIDDKGNLVTEHTTPPMGNMPGGTQITKYK